MDAYLVCCLCSYSAPTETDLEVHIDSDHSDIFRSALNVSDIKTEDLPIAQVQPQVYQPSPVYNPSPVYQQSPVFQSTPQVQSTTYQASPVYQGPSQVQPSTYQSTPVYQGPSKVQSSTYQSTPVYPAPSQVQSTIYQSSPVYPTPSQVQSMSYQVAAQALSTPYQSYSQVSPQSNQQFYQHQYIEQGSSLSQDYPSQTYINEVPAQVTPKVEAKEEFDSNTQCPYCTYSNIRSKKILQNHINKKHPDGQNGNGQSLSVSLPPQTTVTPAPAKNSRKRQSLPSDLTANHLENMQSAKRGKTPDSATFIKMDEKYNDAPRNAQFVSQQSMGSNNETPLQSHSLPFVSPQNHFNKIDSNVQALHTELNIKEETGWPENQQVKNSIERPKQEKTNNKYEVKSLILQGEKIGNSPL